MDWSRWTVSHEALRYSRRKASEAARQGQLLYINLPQCMRSSFLGSALFTSSGFWRADQWIWDLSQYQDSKYRIVRCSQNDRTGFQWCIEQCQQELWFRASKKARKNDYKMLKGKLYIMVHIKYAFSLLCWNAWNWRRHCLLDLQALVARPPQWCVHPPSIAPDHTQWCSLNDGQPAFAQKRLYRTKKTDSSNRRTMGSPCTNKLRKLLLCARLIH